MTKEEAIKWLRDIANDPLTIDPEADAISMAIKALKQPECADAVSRATLRHIFEEHCYAVRYDHNSVDMGMTLPGIVEVLNTAPSVTLKQPGWIPTSVRLPEDNEEVLFCDNEGERWLGWHYGFWKTERLDFDEDEVVAWMPLPTPYREGRQDG